MHVGDDHPGHVAGDAIFLADGTCLAGMIARGLFHWRRKMAAQAFVVIGAWIVNKLLVRVMASDAGKARIAVTPATAVLQTIRLKAQVGDSGRTHLVDVAHSAMASAAEIDESDRIEPARIENGLAALLGLSLVHQTHMFGARAVTRLAGHSVHHVSGIEPGDCGGSRRVTAETAPQRGGIDEPAQGVLEIVGRFAPVTWREIKTLQSLVKAEPTLVEKAVSLIDERLTRISEAERPEERFGNQAGGVADRVDAPFSGA